MVELLNGQYTAMVSLRQYYRFVYVVSRYLHGKCLHSSLLIAIDSTSLSCNYDVITVEMYCTVSKNSCTTVFITIQQTWLLHFTLFAYYHNSLSVFFQCFFGYTKTIYFYFIIYISCVNSYYKLLQSGLWETNFCNFFGQHLLPRDFNSNSTLHNFVNITSLQYC